MFSVLNGYVFRPPPYPASDELERIYRATPGGEAPYHLTAAQGERDRDLRRA
jgi:hypothetical protein